MVGARLPLSMPTASRVVEVAGRSVEITNPDELYFPETRATKGDLVDYSSPSRDAAVGSRSASCVAAAVSGSRARQVLVPEACSGRGARLARDRRRRHANGTTSNALLLADIAHVLWAVNLGCLGFHLLAVHRSIVRKPPTKLRIDLDPQPGRGIDDVRRVALLVAALLDEVGISAYPKTSGNRGIHIYARLVPEWDSIAVRAGAVALARELERRHPDLITAAWWKEERGSRVFVDFNQNARTRRSSALGRCALDWAQVSTPVSWTTSSRSSLTRSRSIRCPPGSATTATLGPRWPPNHSPSSRCSRCLRCDRSAGLQDAPWPPQYPKMPDEPRRVRSEPRPQGPASGRAVAQEPPARHSPRRSGRCRGTDALKAVEIAPQGGPGSLVTGVVGE